MTPPEHYWPPEMLAEAMPERFGHLVARPAPSRGAAGRVRAVPLALPAYTVEPAAGGCAVIRPRFGGEPGVKLRRKPQS